MIMNKVLVYVMIMIMIKVMVMIMVMLMVMLMLMVMVMIMIMYNSPSFSCLSLHTGHSVLAWVSCITCNLYFSTVRKTDTTKFEK